MRPVSDPSRIIFADLFWQSSASLELKFLRVLDVRESPFRNFPIGIFQLVNLRFLAFTCSSQVPTGISRLWNLQTLIARSCFFEVPCEIWELSELRYLNLAGLTWFEDECMHMIHKKLQKISHIVLTHSTIRSGFFESIPNIKKMECYFLSFPSEGVDLSHLHELQILRCRSKFKESGHRVLSAVSFPRNLRELILQRCVIIPAVSVTLSALPNLEVLTIRTCVFESEEHTFNFDPEEAYEQEWEAREGDVFRSLQFLHLEGLDLVRWEADETNFPRLRHLSLLECSELEEIPCGIGEIPTLQLIELEDCSASAVDSAKRMQEVQQSEYDNYDLKLLLH